ncbi:LIM domain-binding protein 2 [Holothuria leucospilota]|uniref:LIM domain-binding protein 2 n=1 Tax=Holothuria leucospilota TaxID=206669 RepID=A0A9Q0YS35_HOLLE|nr:LIM domain-binding protein 2 [Holothuria leucospilota]
MFLFTFPCQVCTEGRLLVEFTFDDMMRIRSWHFAIKQHRELIPRSVVAMQDPSMVEQLSKNITRMGLTSNTLNYLRLCVILEPMQELMSRHKAYNLSPRDCLKATLFEKWQRMVAPPEPHHQHLQNGNARKNDTSRLSFTCIFCDTSRYIKTLFFLHHVLHLQIHQDPLFPAPCVALTDTSRPIFILYVL